MTASNSGSRASIEMVVDPTKKGLPPGVEEIFEPLRNEITYLHGNWHVYRQLFHDPDSDEAIKVTPQGFAMIRYTMRHEIIMCLCRVTDPKTTQRTKENLTIAQLHHAVARNCFDTAFLAELADLEATIDAERKPFIEIRNRTPAPLPLFLVPPSSSPQGHEYFPPDVRRLHVPTSHRLSIQDLHPFFASFWPRALGLDLSATVDRVVKLQICLSISLGSSLIGRQAGRTTRLFISFAGCRQI